MDYEEAVDAVQSALAPLTEHLTGAIWDADTDLPLSMESPLLTEWVLVANVTDMVNNDTRLTVFAAPQMLHSHVVGLLTVAREQAL